MKSKTENILLLSIVLTGLLLFFSACTAKPAESPLSPEQIAAYLLESQSETPALQAVLYDETRRFVDAETASLYLGAAAEQVTGAAICFSTDAAATEFAVFRMTDAPAAHEAVEALEDYLAQRVADFNGYAPAEAAIAEKGVAVQNGAYAALIICADPEAGRKAFSACFGKDAPDGKNLTLEALLFEPADDNQNENPNENPNESERDDSEKDNSGDDADDLFDADAVLLAWLAHDPSSLSGKDLAVYEACAEFIDDSITSDMTDYEKELAVHDWIIARAEYDPAALNPFHHAEIGENDNDNPYGLLIHGKGICLGYAHTFQLMMDLVGIECMTVYGHSSGGNEDHAWNMVRLDDQWYCVDTTWDDPISVFPVSEREAHNYFNVTSEILRNTDHQWDESSVPEAVGTTYRWKKSEK